MINPKTRTIIIWVVLAVWVANFSGGMVVDNYKPNEAVNGIFMIIVGTLFTMGGRGPGGSSNGRRDDDNQPAASVGAGGGKE